jgi:hypothetical protein
MMVDVSVVAKGFSDRHLLCTEDPHKESKEKAEYHKPNSYVNRRYIALRFVILCTCLEFSVWPADHAQSLTFSFT